MNSKNKKDRQDPPPFPEEDATIIIDPEDTELADPQGYDVRPRVEESSVTDSMSDSGEFVVLLPDGDESGGSAHAMGALGITDSGDEWGTAETMRLDAGASTGQFSSVTEFLDSDDPFVADATETYEQHDLSGPMSGSGGATEEVRLLLSTPGYADSDQTLAMDMGGGSPFGDGESEITGLPDLENVEDITALLDDVRTGELSAPNEGFDVDIALGHARPRAGGGLPTGKLLAFAAVIALSVVGYFYGPGLYDKYMGGDTQQVATNSKPPKVSPTPSTGTEGGETVPEVAEVPRSEAQFRTWVVQSLVNNLNAR